MDFSDIVVQKVKELMKEKNLNVSQLSNLTGIYRSTLSAFLSRKNITMRLENLLVVCEALDTTLAEFFSDKRFEEAEAKDWLKRRR